MFLTKNVSLASSTGFMVALLSSLLAVVILAPHNIITLFIVLGQAHFIISYIYQWRAGKIGVKFVLLYAAALGFLWALILSAPQKESLFLVMAGIIFAIHFFVDELYVAHTKFTLERSLVGVGFVLLYSALLFKDGYAIDFGFFLPLLALFLSLPFIVKAIQRKELNASEMLILTSSAVLVMVNLMDVKISIEAMLGFIVLFHYARWYIFYTFRSIEVSKGQLKKYVFNILVVNTLVIGAYFLYTYTSSAPVLVYMFDQTYFFAWTILHILFSANFERLTALQEL
ncbi:MAG: hypothetical protein ISR99_01405 [Parcubacteria group bacterium]|nr:hypothetical protein [Parcubacteria group bacterium]